MIISLIGILVLSALVGREMRVETNSAVKRWTGVFLWFIALAALFGSPVFLGLAIFAAVITLLARLLLPDDYGQEKL